MPTATISEKKRAANRANARKSTGPRTPEGKARASLNAISHGLFCKDLVLPGESREVFDLIRRGWIFSLNPQDIAELWLVDRIVAASWKLRRLQETESLLHQTDGHELLHLKEAEDELNRPFSHDERGEDSLESKESPVPPEMILSVQLSCQEKSARFERLARHEQRLEQSVHRAMRQLRQLRKDRDKEEELPRSPFLDEPEIEEEDKEDMGGPPMPQQPRSTEHQNDENEPTAEREDASGEQSAGEKPVNRTAVARAPRPCCDFSNKKHKCAAGARQLREDDHRIGVNIDEH